MRRQRDRVGRRLRAGVDRDLEAARPVLEEPFRDAPALETVLLNRPDLTSEGAGETPIIGIAPAVGNALFAATGVRLRSMPMIPDGLEIK